MDGEKAHLFGGIFGTAEAVPPLKTTCEIASTFFEGQEQADTFHPAKGAGWRRGTWSKRQRENVGCCCVRDDNFLGVSDFWWEEVASGEASGI
jgi:hypothetical protein